MVVIMMCDFVLLSCLAIADELGVAWSTAKDAVKKVRQLAQEHTGLTRN